MEAPFNFSVVPRRRQFNAAEAGRFAGVIDKPELEMRVAPKFPPESARGMGRTFIGVQNLPNADHPALGLGPLQHALERLFERR